MPVWCNYNGTIVKKHRKIRTDGQKPMTLNKKISFDNYYVEKLIIALLCGHLEC